MKIRFGSNIAIFLIFFGISLLDALQSQAWMRAGLWLALGFVFLFADRRGVRGED